MRLTRGTLLFIAIAFIGAFVITRGLVTRPTYTDAYYHFNGAVQLADGNGFTDEYLWVYVGNPETLPAPSHLYWMPLISTLASLGMSITDSTDYAVAQLPFTLMFAGAILVGYWLGGKLGGTTRHQWQAGLLTLFSGLFVRWWGAIDTFSPYALIGSLCLVFIGLGINTKSKTRKRLVYWLLAGALAGLAHLTRADGLLFLIVGWLVLIFPWNIVGIELPKFSRRGRWLIVFTLAYFIIMLPWFMRNLDAIGSLLPTSGTQAIWFTEYNDLFSYPADVTSNDLLGNGFDLLIESRWTALTNNLGTFVAVEGLIVLSPLMLLGLWNRRKNPFLLAFGLYALGIHLAMTFVFPFPGYRGGLFHSVSALVPWWAILGLVGLDDLINWIAKHRRSWRPQTAKPVFSSAIVLLAIVLSYQFGLSKINFTPASGTPSLYRELINTLPENARIMINDPAALYYFTGMGGVVTPNASPETIPQIAERYAVTHVLIEFNEQSTGTSYAIPEQLFFDLDNPPSFLTEVSLNVSSARLYAIIIE